MDDEVQRLQAENEKLKKKLATITEEAQAQEINVRTIGVNAGQTVMALVTTIRIFSKMDAQVLNSKMRIKESYNITTKLAHNMKKNDALLKEATDYTSELAALCVDIIRVRDKGRRVFNNIIP